MTLFQVMPDMERDGFEALRESIGKMGVLVPVEYDEAGNIIDGHHRVKACNELGIKKWPRVVRSYEDDTAKRSMAITINTQRRHLDRAARQSLIEARLRASTEISNRQIAAELNVDHKTVGSVRKELEACGEIPHVETLIDTTGREQPSRKPSVVKVDFAKNKVRGTQGTGENEWYTPPEFIESARQVMGSIDIDPASSTLAQQTVQAASFFSLDDDGLTKDWDGNVWMNPPYAQPFIAHFSDKLLSEWGAGRISAAVVLTHNYTDTTWFHALASRASAICFTRGRIRFVSPGGELASPTQGQAFFYFGEYADRFCMEFNKYGLVMRPETGEVA